MDGQLKTSQGVHIEAWGRVGRFPNIELWSTEGKWINGMAFFMSHTKWDLHVKFKTMGEFLYGLWLRKYPLLKSKAKEGTKHHLNVDKSWRIPGINFANSLLQKKKKSDLTFSIKRAIKTEAQGPIFAPFEIAEIPKLWWHTVLLRLRRNRLCHILLLGTQTAQPSERGGEGDLAISTKIAYAFAF